MIRHCLTQAGRRASIVLAMTVWWYAVLPYVMLPIRMVLS